MSDYYAVVYSDSLSHHGVKGQKWGQRRFQNEDGSLTDAGKARYNVADARRAAIEGGVIGYARYRKTHSGRAEAVKQYKADKRAEKENARIAKQKAEAARQKSLVNVKGDKDVRIALDKDRATKGSDTKGVRRYMNMKRDERDLRDKGNKKYKMDELEAYAKAEEAWNNLGSKSKIDQQRYSNAKSKVDKKVSDSLINKYGQEAYDSMQKVDKAKSYALLAAWGSVAIGMTVAKYKTK